MPSQLPTILNDGLKSRLNADDIARQDKQFPDLEPQPGSYVAKFKYLGAGYPAIAWSKDQKERLGETFTKDDTGSWFCVLEGRHVLWCEEDARSNRVWEQAGHRHTKTKILTNQQWLVRPDSITWERVHFYKVALTGLRRNQEKTLREEMNWDEKKWNSRRHKGATALEISDIPEVLSRILQLMNLVVPLQNRFQITEVGCQDING